MTPGRAIREIAGLIAGFSLWSLAFALLYGAHGTICAIGAESGVGGRIVLIALWAAMLALEAALVGWLVGRLRSAPPELQFVRRITLILAVAATGATIWTGLPILTLNIC